VTRIEKVIGTGIGLDIGYWILELGYRIWIDIGRIGT
jgi:hypothetical protein